MDIGLGNICYKRFSKFLNFKNNFTPSKCNGEYLKTCYNKTLKKISHKIIGTLINDINNQ